MSMPPLVSIVVPVFNGMPYLAALTDRLINQTYPSLEIIFSVGGGTDGSLDFLKTIQDPRVRIVELPQGTTAAENWTSVSMEARGDYTKLICQDDEINADAVALQVADLQTHPDAVMAIAQRDVIDANGKTLFRGRGFSGIHRGTATIDGSALIRMCYRQGTNIIGEPLAVLFRTTALQQALPWLDANPLMLDLSMYQKVAPTGQVVLRWQSIGGFRVSTSSWSTRLAHLQAEQTKRWQVEYADSANPAPNRWARAQAALGRIKQTTLRRAAYQYLRARGSMQATLR